MSEAVNTELCDEQLVGSNSYASLSIGMQTRLARGVGGGLPGRSSALLSASVILLRMVGPSKLMVLARFQTLESKDIESVIPTF